MNKLFNKLDDWFFKQVEKILLDYVKQTKHREHKYQAYLSILNWMPIVFIISVPVLDLVYLFFGILPFSTLLVRLTWCFVLLIYASEKRSIRQTSEIYTTVFNLRKNAYVHKQLKEYLESSYSGNKNSRIFKLKFTVIVLFFFCFVNSLVALGALASGDFFDVLPVLSSVLFFFFHLFVMEMERYSHYVFDFDEPTDDDKDTSKDRLTNLQKARLSDLLSSAMPIGV